MTCFYYLVIITTTTAIAIIIIVVVVVVVIFLLLSIIERRTIPLLADNNRSDGSEFFVDNVSARILSNGICALLNLLSRPTLRVAVDSFHSAKIFTVYTRDAAIILCDSLQRCSIRGRHFCR